MCILFTKINVGLQVLCIFMQVDYIYIHIGFVDKSNKGWWCIYLSNEILAHKNIYYLAKLFYIWKTGVFKFRLKLFGFGNIFEVIV